MQWAESFELSFADSDEFRTVVAQPFNKHDDERISGPIYFSCPPVLILIFRLKKESPRLKYFLIGAEKTWGG